jgi:hypothetical protein
VQYEPGLDVHVWESRWQALQDELRAAPREALPEAADLVEEMLVTSGYDLADPVSRAGDAREVVAEYQAARDVSDRVERGDPVDPGDVAAALEGLSAVHGYLVTGDGGS